jgi:chromosome segregation ATPase
MRDALSAVAPSSVRPLAVTLTLTIAAAVGWSAAGRAQSAGASPDVLNALLMEVRGLRAAMELMAAAGPRVQLALGRLQLQEQRINNLVRRLETVRASLAPAQKEHDELVDNLREQTELLPARSPTDRPRYEGEITQIKTNLTRISGDLQRLLNEEALLNQEIAIEQGRWTNFNQRLEELERSLLGR